MRFFVATIFLLGIIISRLPVANCTIEFDLIGCARSRFGSWEMYWRFSVIIIGIFMVSIFIL